MDYNDLNDKQKAYYDALLEYDIDYWFVEALTELDAEDACIHPRDGWHDFELSEDEYEMVEEIADAADNHEFYAKRHKEGVDRLMREIRWSNHWMKQAEKEVA